MKIEVLLLAVLLPSPLLAQGLGDTAARERQKREEKKPAPPAKVFTNQDLPAPAAPASPRDSGQALPVIPRDSGQALPVIPRDSGQALPVIPRDSGVPGPEESAVPADPSSPGPDAAPRGDKATGQDAASQADKTPGDAASQADKAPGDAASQADKTPGDAASQGDKAPGDAASQEDPLEKERQERKLLEAEWRVRFANAREQLAIAETNSWREVVRTQFYQGIPVQMRVKEQVETEELLQARKALADLTEEFRHTGFPPGWARE